MRGTACLAKWPLLKPARTTQPPFWSGVLDPVAHDVQRHQRHHNYSRGEYIKPPKLKCTPSLLPRRWLGGWRPSLRGTWLAEPPQRRRDAAERARDDVAEHDVEAAVALRGQGPPGLLRAPVAEARVEVEVPVELVFRRQVHPEGDVVRHGVRRRRLGAPEIGRDRAETRGATHTFEAPGLEVRDGLNILNAWRPTMSRDQHAVVQQLASDSGCAASALMSQET